MLYINVTLQGQTSILDLILSITDFIARGSLSVLCTKCPWFKFFAHRIIDLEMINQFYKLHAFLLNELHSFDFINKLIRLVNYFF